MPLNISPTLSNQLGRIPDLIKKGKELKPGFLGLQYMVQLGGCVLFQSDLDLDTDGREDPGIRYEPTHQKQTSIDPSGKIVSSNATPYIVLPMRWAKDLGIKMGDVAAVMYNGRLEFAVLADAGPSKKIGEGSIALHRSLGFERVRPDGRIHDVGIDHDVVTIIFPGTGDGTAQTPEKIRELGAKLLADLTTLPTPAPAAGGALLPLSSVQRVFEGVSRELEGAVESMPIRVKLMREGAKLPTYGTLGAAGMDFYWCPDPKELPEILKAGRSRRVFRLGVAMAIPEGYYLQLEGRSGLALKYGISVLAGVIDDDFRGELLAVLEADDQGWMQANVQPGDRVVQGILKKKIASHLEAVEELPATERGERGCGSTGR